QKTQDSSKGAKEKQPAKTSKAKGLTVLSEVALTEAEQMKLATKQSLTQTHISHASGSGADEGTGIIPGVPDVPTYESNDKEISWKSCEEDDDDDEVNTNDDDDQNDDDDDGDQDDDDDDEQTDLDNDGDDFIHPKFSTHYDKDKEKKSFDPIVQTPSHDEKSNDEDNDEDSHGMNVEGDEIDDEGANEEDDVNELYRDVNINLEGQDIQMADVQTTQVNNRDRLCHLDLFRTCSTQVQIQTNQFAEAISLILGIVDKYLDHRMDEAVKVVIQLQSDKFRDGAQAENKDFLNKLDENIQKIIKEQVKEQVKAQVSKILPKIKKTVNEQLKAEVLTRSSNSSKTSHIVATNQSELKLEKMLIEKMESNKSIHRSDEQKNLYKALVDAYECDKLILNTYEDTVTLKRRQDDEDKDKEPFAGSNRGSMRRRAGKEPESTNALKEKTSKTTGKSTEGSKSHHKSAIESAPAEEPMHTTKDLKEPAHQEFDTAKPPTSDRAWNKTFPATHGPIQPWINNLARKDDSRTSFNELMVAPLDFSAFIMNRLKVDTLTPELLAGLTYELMKGSRKSLVELEFFFEEVYKATTDQLDWNNPEVTKTNASNYGHIKWIEDLVPRTMWSQVPESSRDVYSKRRIIVVTELQIVEWLNYKHLDWIIVRRDDDKLYKFKEGDFKRLRIQDIKDMLLLLVQGVESYQKKINLTKPGTYRSDLKRKEAYTSYSNPRGFIYQNKDKQNRLIRIDELHKFSDGTLNDVRTALDDRLKGIRI
nr:hypothetical protein [Tanacetum cinerariifolium]